MKRITAYIQPCMADAVADALRNIRVHGLTMIRCHGFGRMIDAPAPHYADAADTLGFVDKTKLEIVCADADKDRIVAAIRVSAHTGRHGDGKIFVSTVDEATDIRTGDTGEGVV